MAVNMVPLQWDPLGSLPRVMGSPGFPRVTSHGNPEAPKGPLPWAPLGSQRFPPISRSPSMGSLGLPRVPPSMGSLGLPRIGSHRITIRMIWLE